MVIVVIDWGGRQQCCRTWTGSAGIQVPTQLIVVITA
jgi:hypothetical protein